MFHLFIVVLGLATGCLSWVIKGIARLAPGIRVQKAGAWLPVLAGACMVISIFLPNIHISQQTTTFQQHLVGGGLYAACLYYYARQLFGWRLHGVVDLLAIFAWVSALGVANKLIEFAFLELGVSISTADAYWDLLANTIGGIIGFLAYNAIAWPSRTKAGRDRTPVVLEVERNLGASVWRRSHTQRIEHRTRQERTEPSQVSGPTT